jgi:hypothetical protein
MILGPPAAPLSARAIWSTPPCRMDIDQRIGMQAISFEFNVALPIVQMLARGIEYMTVSIEPSTSESTYAFFDGDATDIEESISSFFKRSMTEESASVDPEYYAYYYNKTSLRSFVSDKIISEMGRIREATLVTDPFGSMSSLGGIEAYSRVKNEFSYLIQGDTPEASFSSKLGPINTHRTIKQCINEVAGIYSVPPCLIADAAFPRNLTNRQSEGDTTSSPDRIKIGSEKYPSAFWELWANYYDYSDSVTETIPDIRVDSIDHFPVKITGEINFADSDDGAAQALMATFLLRDSMVIRLSFSTGNDGIEYEDMIQPISAVSMLMKSLGAVKEMDYLVEASSTADIMHINNTNKADIIVFAILVGWHDYSSSMDMGQIANITIKAGEEKQLPFPTAIEYESRFYMIFQYSTLYSYLPSGASSEIIDKVVVNTGAITVPGVANVIKPELSDPRITITRHAGGTALKINVDNVPPYVDEIKYYFKPVSRARGGPGSHRSPGSNRNSFTFVKTDPALSSWIRIPVGECTIPYGDLAPSKYLFVADLYRKGAVINTVNTYWEVEPMMSGLSQLVDWTFSIASSNYSDDLTVAEIAATTADGATALLVGGINASINETYAHAYESTVASSKVASYYSVSRSNTNGIIEPMGVLVAGQVGNYPHGEHTTPNHTYTVKQHVATAGQCISMVQSIKTTPVWPIGGGGGQRVYYEYAKWASADVIKKGVLPSMSYTTNWFLRALTNSYTGYCKSQEVNRDTMSYATITDFSVEYDSIRRTNFVSWNLDSSGIEIWPSYFIVTASYGGITAPIGWQLYISRGPAGFYIADEVLAGALGTVRYHLHTIYPHGVSVEEDLTCSMMHSSDNLEHVTMGRGL